MATATQARNTFAVSAERHFSHTGPNGTQLKANRSDFRGKTFLVRPQGLTDAKFVQDIAAIIGYHATNILPNLMDGFSGYDATTYAVRIEKDAAKLLEEFRIHASQSSEEDLGNIEIYLRTLSDSEINLLMEQDLTNEESYMITEIIRPRGL